MTDLSPFIARILAIWTDTDPLHRRAAIEAAYDADCLFTDPDGTYTGRAGIEQFSDSLQRRFPGFTFTAVSIDGHHDVARTYWNFGPAQAPDTVRGVDITLIRDGRIHALYAFVDHRPPDINDS